MPWNDQPKHGPWGAKTPPGGGGSGDGSGGGDGGGHPRLPAPRPPEFEDILRRLGQALHRLISGQGGVSPTRLALLAAAALGALWLMSGGFVVQPDQEGVITTFGAYGRTEGPGLRYHLPAPIEDVEKVSVTSLQRIDIGDTSVPDAAGATAPTDSLMLTGDENIVDLDFSVSWRVADAGAYLFNLRDPDGAVRDVAESAMREVVGQMPLQAILTTGRGDVQIRVADQMQKILDGYNAGVTVVEVQIQAARPPSDVLQAFRDVANAGQEAESKVNEANAYRNRVVSEAIGDASKITQSAEAYREQTVREAEGDTARFNQIYEEYKRAPAVTRQRLYLETMEKVLAKSNKVIVDNKGASAPIILPPDAFRARTPPQQITIEAPPAPTAAPPSNEQGGQ